MAAALLACALGGCQVSAPGAATPTDGTAQQKVSYPTDEVRAAALAKADFERAIPLRIELRDHAMTPQLTRLVRGQPYRLTVQNFGSVNHYLNAPEFLRSIAARHVEVRGEVEVSAPYFSRFEVARRGGQFQLDFVPLVPGDFRAFCHLAGEEHVGVAGRIIVE